MHSSRSSSSYSNTAAGSLAFLREWGRLHTGYRELTRLGFFYAVADPGEEPCGPAAPLVLDQTEARRAENNFF